MKYIKGNESNFYYNFEFISQLYNLIKHILLCHINHMQGRGSEVLTSVVMWNEVQLGEVE